jgi:hypothetical protein
MSNSEFISMLVCWEQQRRMINLKNDDSLYAIEKSVENIYNLHQSNNFYEYQIQYYNRHYQTFIDLCPESFTSFQQILQELFLPNAPPKSEQIWRLKVIPKAGMLYTNKSYKFDFFYLKIIYHMMQ